MLKANLHFFLELHASMRPRQIALICGDDRLTFDQLNRRANRLSHGLLDLGLKKGDAVALLMNNSLEMAEWFYGISKASGVMVPLNTMLSSSVLSSLVDRSEASTLVYEPSFQDLVDGIREGAGKVKYRITLGESQSPDLISHQGIRDGFPDDNPGIDVVEDDPFAIFFTAGATGEPKGVVSTHRSVTWGAMNAILTVGLEQRVSCLASPMFHVAGMGVVATSITRGGRCVIFRRYDPAEILRTIEDEKITNLFLVPTMWMRMIYYPGFDKYDTSSIKSVSTAGSQATPELKRKILERFPGAGLREVYGLTEIGALGTMLLPGDPTEKVGSVGRPAALNKLRIVDDDGNDLAQGEVGEIAIQSLGVMREYLNDPEATSRAIKDGWLHTGDLGRLDEDGFLYIMGRKDEMIVSGGENIYPLSIEKVLNTHPKVLESSVIGVPDPEWGWVVKAFIILKAGESMDGEEVKDYCGDKLGGMMKPRLVEFVESLPRAAAGKVYKRALK